MLKRETLIQLAIILAIFTIGLILRLESTHLSGIPDNQKPLFQNEDGIPYMYEMDSYYNYRLTKNYIGNGVLGDTVINGSDWDLHSHYPPGRSVDYPPFIVYLTAFFYKFINLFLDVPLLTICFWFPAFFAPLSGIPAYLFVRKLTNDYGGLTAGILAVTSTFYFMRTVPGRFDTDIFTVLFPILIVWFFVEAVYAESTKKKIYFAILSAISMFLFSLAWFGSWYIFYVIIFSSLIYIIGCKLKGIKIKNFYTVFVTFLIIPLTLILIFTDFSTFLTIIDPLGFMKSTGIGAWPDTYISVFELMLPPADEIIYGIVPTVVLGFLGILSIFIAKRKGSSPQLLNSLDWFFYVLIIFWILTALFAITKGARFIIMLIPPAVIGAGITIGVGIGFRDRFTRKKLAKVLSILILFIIVVSPIMGAYSSFSTFKPSVNDDLWNSAEWIRSNTPDNTIIISEWTYGHFFTAIANRPVAVDGGSQNTPREYWINKALSTSNETLSYGILSMLTNSGDATYLTLDEYTNNTSKSVEILNNILGVNKSAATDILMNNYHFNQNQTDEILKYTHNSIKNNFVFVTNDEMINNGYWVFYFGNWDFMNMKGGNYTYSVCEITVNNTVLKTSNGVTMDLKTGDVKWNNKTPYCVMIINGDKIEKRYLDRDSNFCVILMMADEKSVIIDKRFENSMFTRLVIEKGNLTCFKPLYRQGGVIVWKANCSL